jgi:hypothetical protein
MGAEFPGLADEFTRQRAKWRMVQESNLRDPKVSAH